MSAVRVPRYLPRIGIHTGPSIAEVVKYGFDCRVIVSLDLFVHFSRFLIDSERNQEFTSFGHRKSQLAFRCGERCSKLYKRADFRRNFYGSPLEQCLNIIYGENSQFERFL